MPDHRRIWCDELESALMRSGPMVAANEAHDHALGAAHAAHALHHLVGSREQVLRVLEQALTG
jgi:hypothetical protein